MGIDCTACFTIPSKGDYRSREANVHLLAEVSRSTSSTNVWLRCFLLPENTGACLTAALFWRGAGFKNVLRQGQTGQQLLLGAYYSALSRQVSAGRVKRCTTATGNVG